MRARWCLLAALAVVLVACGGSSPGDQRTRVGTNVSFDVPITPGGGQLVRLSGVERGRGRVGVVLAHMLSSSQGAWSPIVGDIVDAGFHVLTFDFRGHGLSDGTRDPSRADLDLAGAVAKLRSLGASRVLVVGASMGGTAALVVAATEDLAAVVTLSAPAKIDSLDAGAVIGKVTEPTLFIAGEKDDARYTDAARSLYAAAHGPKHLEVVSGTGAHGTNLLTDKNAANTVKARIMDFLIANRG